MGGGRIGRAGFSNRRIELSGLVTDLRSSRSSGLFRNVSAASPCRVRRELPGITCKTKGAVGAPPGQTYQQIARKTLAER